MPRKKTPGRDRLDVKADPALLDLAAAAAAATRTDLSSYVRRALVRQLEEDGFRVPPPAPSSSTRVPAQALSGTRDAAGAGRERPAPGGGSKRRPGRPQKRT
jgi:hypothetical protein